MWEELYLAVQYYIWLYIKTRDHINNDNWFLDDCRVQSLTSYGSILIISGERVKSQSQSHMIY